MINSQSQKKRWGILNFFVVLSFGVVSWKKMLGIPHHFAHIVFRCLSHRRRKVSAGLRFPSIGSVCARWGDSVLEILAPGHETICRSLCLTVTFVWWRKIITLGQNQSEFLVEQNAKFAFGVDLLERRSKLPLQRTLAKLQGPVLKLVNVRHYSQCGEWLWETNTLIQWLPQ